MKQAGYEFTVSVQRLCTQIEVATWAGVLTSKEAGALLALKLDADAVGSSKCPRGLQDALSRFRLFMAKPSSHSYH